MSKSLKIISFFMIMTILSSCQNGQVSKQGVGTAVGAATGAILGSAFGKGEGRTAAILLGGVAGAFVGNQIGASLDKADRAHYQQTANSTFETMQTGSTSTWVNPDSGNRGSFTPTKTFQGNDGRYCREFTQKIVVANKVQEGYGTACRQPDGTWEIVK